MKLLGLLACLSVASTVQAALRMPWAEKNAYDLAARQQATRTHSAPQRRASGIDDCDPMNACAAGQCPTGDCDACVVNTAGSRRSYVPEQTFSGEILDPYHAALFLLSDSGTYAHQNGTTIVDRHYHAGRRQRLKERAQQGLIKRWAAQSLGAFVRFIPKSYVANSMLRDLSQKHMLHVFSSQTAIDRDDAPEVVEELLKHEWDSLTIGAISIERETVLFMKEVFAGRKTLEDADE